MTPGDGLYFKPFDERLKERRSYPEEIPPEDDLRHNAARRRRTPTSLQIRAKSPKSRPSPRQCYAQRK